MKPTRNARTRIVAKSMLFVALLFGSQFGRESSANRILQDPSPTVSSDIMMEEAPEGYFFPYEDGTGTTPGDPLPDPELLLVKGPSLTPGVGNRAPVYRTVSGRGTGSGFDLGVWLSHGRDVLSITTDPVSLHQIGQRILAFQRGPLVDELGVEFLEKASLQDTSLTWTANNYAVAYFNTHGISQTCQDLFEEASNRSLRNRTESADSLATQNRERLRVISERISARVSRALSQHSSSSLVDKTHLQLVGDLIFSNRLAEAREHIAEATSDPRARAVQELLKGRLLEREGSYGAAAAVLRGVAGSLRALGHDSEDQIAIIERKAAVLEENARAAAKSAKQPGFDITLWQKTLLTSSATANGSSWNTLVRVSWSEPVFVTFQLTVRAKVINPFYFFGFNGVQFYGGAFAAAAGEIPYRVLENVPFLRYRTVYGNPFYRARRDEPWFHCANHVDLVPLETCYVVIQPAKKSYRLSWIFF